MQIVSTQAKTDHDFLTLYLILYLADVHAVSQQRIEKSRGGLENA